MHFLWRFGASRRSAACGESLVAVSIFRVISAMEFALRTASSIVRFRRIIIGRAGWTFLRDLWFVLLGLAVVLEMVGLTG